MFRLEFKYIHWLLFGRHVGTMLSGITSVYVQLMSNIYCTNEQKSEVGEILK